MINEDASKKPVQKTEMPRMERKVRRRLKPAFLVDRQARLEAVPFPERLPVTARKLGL